LSFYMASIALDEIIRSHLTHYTIFIPLFLLVGIKIRQKSYKNSSY